MSCSYYEDLKLQKFWVQCGFEEKIKNGNNNKCIVHGENNMHL